MEHRKSERVPAHVGVLIYQKDLPVAVGQIRNASKDGLLVITRFSGVDLHQKLDIKFRLTGDGDRLWKSMRTILVRKTDSGLALECDDEDPVQARVISKLIDSLRATELPPFGEAGETPMRDGLIGAAHSEPRQELGQA